MQTETIQPAIGSFGVGEKEHPSPNGEGAHTVRHIARQQVDELKKMMPTVLQAVLGVEDVTRFFCCPDPDHDDRTPSAHYYADTGDIKCFGCGGKWDVFDLVGITEGVEGFRDQVARVAEICGVDLVYDEPSKSRQIRSESSARPARAQAQGAPKIRKLKPAGGMDVGQACREAYLKLYSKDGGFARQWLHGRGIDDDQIKRHGLGMAIVPQDISPAFIVFMSACVFVSIPYWSRDYGSADYVVLRTASMPQRERNHKEWRPKGVSSPLWREWTLTAGERCVYVCEGPIDAMALEVLLASKGIENPTVMALGGTSMSGRLSSVIAEAPEELRPKKLVLALDDDAAGHKCAESIERDMKILGITCKRVGGYGGHKDPDDWLCAERGKSWHFEEEALPGLSVPYRRIVWDKEL